MTLLNYTDFVPTPAPLASGAALASYTDPTGEVWVAKGGVRGGVFLKARDVLHAKYYRNAAMTLTAGAWANVNMDTLTYDDYGVYSTSTGLFTPPIVGAWHMIVCSGMTPTATAQWVQPGIWRTSPSNVICDPLAHASGTYPMKTIGSTVWRTVAGDTYYIRVAASTACALSVGAFDTTYFEMHYTGTG